jgi:hypothetical protein
MMAIEAYFITLGGVASVFVSGVAALTFYETRKRRTQISEVVVTFQGEQLADHVLAARFAVDQATNSLRPEALRGMQTRLRSVPKPPARGANYREGWACPDQEDRAGVSWGVHERRWLGNRFEEGATRAELAKEHGRTENAIVAQLCYMSLLEQDRQRRTRVVSTGSIWP